MQYIVPVLVDATTQIIIQIIQIIILLISAVYTYILWSHLIVNLIVIRITTSINCAIIVQ